MNVQELAADMTRGLEAAGIATRREIRPGTAADVAALEARLGLPLPAAYQAFLRAVGRGAGIFYEGTDLFLNHLPLPRGDFEQLLRAGSGLDLPPAAYVFASHQGYQFLYFLTGDDDDPPVYSYLEAEPRPEQVFAHFTDWFRQSVKDHAEFVDDD